MIAKTEQEFEGLKKIGKIVAEIRDSDERSNCSW